MTDRHTNAHGLTLTTRAYESTNLSLGRRGMNEWIFIMQIAGWVVRLTGLPLANRTGSSASSRGTRDIGWRWYPAVGVVCVHHSGVCGNQLTVESRLQCQFWNKMPTTTLYVMDVSIKNPSQPTSDTISTRDFARLYFLSHSAVIKN